LPGVFLAEVFLTATFLTKAFLTGVFLAEAFLTATFLTGAFLTATFFTDATVPDVRVRALALLMARPEGNRRVPTNVAPSALLAHLEFFPLWLSLNLCSTSI